MKRIRKERKKGNIHLKEERNQLKQLRKREKNKKNANNDEEESEDEINYSEFEKMIEGMTLL